jgi:hypothetical protein
MKAFGFGRRTLRAETLQWTGLLAGALVWTGQHIVGFGTTLARCSPGGAAWGVSIHTWEIVLTIVAALFVLGAEAAAVTILAETWGVEEDGEPPVARRHFFAVAAALGNVLFLSVILLGGLGVLTLDPCRQA